MIAAGSSRPATVRDVVLARTATVSAAATSRAGRGGPARGAGRRRCPDRRGRAGRSRAGRMYRAWPARRRTATSSASGTSCPARPSRRRSPPMRRVAVNRARSWSRSRVAAGSTWAGWPGTLRPRTRRQRRTGTAWRRPRAAGLGAHREAADHLRTALQFASGRPASERAQLCGEFADECMSPTRWTRRWPRPRRRCGCGRGSATRSRVGSAHTGLDAIYWNLAQGGRASAHMQPALEVLEPLGPTSSWRARSRGARPTTCARRQR